MRSVNPIPRPKPNPSSADIAERGVASIGVRSSGNLSCVFIEFVCVLCVFILLQYLLCSI